MAFSLGGGLFAVTVIAAVFGVRVGGSGFWSGSDFLTVEMGIVGAAVFMGSLRFSISCTGWGKVRFTDLSPDLSSRG